MFIFCVFCSLEIVTITFISFFCIHFYAKFVSNRKVRSTSREVINVLNLNNKIFDFDLLSRIYQFFEFIDNVLQFKNSSALNIINKQL